MNSLLTYTCSLAVLLFFASISAEGQRKYESKINDFELEAHAYNKHYNQFTLVGYKVFSSNQSQSYEFELSSLLHYNSIASGNVNGLLVFNDKELAGIKNTNPKLNYNFSHSILTKGIPYNEFINQSLVGYTLNFTPEIRGIALIDRYNILIASNTGIYLLKVSKWGGESELVLLKESDFDVKGMIAYYFSDIVSVDGNIIKLTWRKCSLDIADKQTDVSMTFTLDTTKNKLQ